MRVNSLPLIFPLNSWILSLRFQSNTLLLIQHIFLHSIPFSAQSLQMINLLLQFIYLYLHYFILIHIIIIELLSNYYEMRQSLGFKAG